MASCESKKKMEKKYTQNYISEWLINVRGSIIPVGLEVLLA